LLALSSSGCGATSSAPTSAGTAAQARAEAPAKEISGIQLLNSRAKPADTPDPEIQKSQILSDLDLDWSRSRLAGYAPPKWLVPDSASAHICIVSPGAVSCAETARLSSVGASPEFSYRQGAGYRVSGIALDGVRSVRINLGNGEHLRAVVRHNFFGAMPQRSPESVTWRYRDEPQTLKFR
jgi:hypothetical protein